MVNGEGLMAGLEIENMPFAPGVGAAAAEHFAALEPADEHQLVRLGDLKVLAVGFLVLDDNVIV